MDKLCIAQSGPKKQAGIHSIAAFLSNSEHMLLLWNEDYFERLWCVLECGAMMHATGRVSSIIVAPLFLAPFEIAGCVGVICVWLTYDISVHTGFTVWMYTSIGEDLEWFASMLVASIAALPLAIAFTLFLWPAQKARRNLSVCLSQFTFDDAKCFNPSDRVLIVCSIGGFILVASI